MQQKLILSKNSKNITFIECEVPLKDIMIIVLIM